jgi:predicted DNA-binding protein with PD1-like motif
LELRTIAFGEYAYGPSTDPLQWRSLLVHEWVEVITAIGDIVPDEKRKASLHAQTVLGRSDGSSRGGRLQEGHLRPTLEVTITETPERLTQRKHPDLTSRSGCETYRCRLMCNSSGRLAGYCE